MLVADLKIAGNGYPEMPPLVIAAKAALNEVFPSRIPVRSPWPHRLAQTERSIPSHLLHTILPIRIGYMLEQMKNKFQAGCGF